MRPSHLRTCGYSPLLSLRADLAGRMPTREDDDAIVVATLLRHAAGDPSSSAAKRSLAKAHRVARRALTPEQLRQGPGFDEPRHGLRFRAIRAFADRVMRVRGCTLLANNMLDSLADIVPSDSPEFGPLLAQRAAVSWYLGDNEMSAERYQQVIRFGKRAGRPALIARGLQGAAHVRMSAGNLPEAERLAKRVLPYVKTSPRSVAQATLKLAIINAVRGDFDVALQHAWRAYNLSKRFEMDRRVVLANLAQILYDAGHPAASRAAATHLLRQELGHMQVFAVLGTHARASAALDDARAVDWCAAQVLELAKPPSFTQYVADALLECSFALEEVGRAAKATRLRKRAHAIAVRHGYHDIAYLAEHSTPRGKPRTPVRVPKTTQAIVSEVRALEPEQGSLMELHAG